MKKSLLLLSLTLFLASCSDEDDKDVFLSRDAQIYSFSLEGESEAEKAILRDVKFSIDQLQSHIYTSKHLDTDVRKFRVNMTFSPQYPITGVAIIYPNKVEDWDNTTFIDFSLNPKIKVTAQDVTSERIYTITLP